MALKRLFLLLLPALVVLAPGCRLFETVPYYTLTVEVLGGGEVITSPFGTVHKKGTEVTLTAAPADEPWVFSHWAGHLAGTETQEAKLTMDADKHVTAVFGNGITGMVTKGRRGPGVAGATITAVCSGKEIDRTTTDNTGRYSLPIPPGEGKTRIDLIAGQDGLAGTRFQDIVVYENDLVVADIILKEPEPAVLGAEEDPPRVCVCITGVGADNTVSGTVNITIDLAGEGEIKSVLLDVGREDPGHIINTPPFSMGLDTRGYPDGDSFIHIVVYDLNNNCVITRLPVTVNNYGKPAEPAEPVLVMSKPVYAWAVTEGDDMWYSSLPGSGGWSIGLGGRDPLSRLRPDGFSTQAAAERSACYIILDWDEEFAAGSGFAGYNVYRSSSPVGPWRRLGAAGLAYDKLNETWYYTITDTTPEVTPGVPSYYKVVPYHDSGSEGAGQVQSVIPLGRFEVNLASPEHNAEGVSLTPILCWRHNGPAAGLYHYELCLYDPAPEAGSEQPAVQVATAVCETDNPNITSLAYDPAKWTSGFDLAPNWKYQWDIIEAWAKTTYNVYSAAVSYGVRGSQRGYYNTGSYNGAFVFTTGD